MEIEMTSYPVYLCARQDFDRRDDQPIGNAMTAVGAARVIRQSLNGGRGDVLMLADVECNDRDGLWAWWPIWREQ